MASVWDRWDALIHSPDSDPLEIVAAASTYHRYLNAVEAAAVKAARRAGATWQDIADAAGTRRQTSWEKWRETARLTEGAPERFSEEVLAIQRAAIAEVQNAFAERARRRKADPG